MDNDCVIVPNFGGFVAHHVEAHYDERDGLFLPPIRTLGFNSKLNMNDQLLVQSYVDTYDISYPEALSRIYDDVDELKSSLNKYGFYEFGDMGVLTLNENGIYGFEPNESGILSPEMYALAGCRLVCTENGGKNAETSICCVSDAPVCGDCQVDNIIGLKNAKVVLDSKPFSDGETNSKHRISERTISIKVSSLRNVFAVACAILAFFFLSAPISTEVYKNGMEISSIGNGLLYNLVPVNVQSKSLICDNVKDCCNSATFSNNKKKCLSISNDRKKSLGDSLMNANRYCIVLACKISRVNAMGYVKRLHASGFNDAMILDEENAPLKVVYGKYFTEAQAISELARLKHNKFFKDSWIYILK